MSEEEEEKKRRETEKLSLFHSGRIPSPVTSRYISTNNNNNIINNPHLTQTASREKSKNAKTSSMSLRNIPFFFWSMPLTAPKKRCRQAGSSRP
jgi:hypothetical protein